jgi:hypothetical protein
MSNPLVVQESRAIPVPVEQAYEWVLPVPLTSIFDRWFGPFPAVREVSDLRDDWGTVGQSRTIRTADGGSLREEITSVAPPHSFGYTISDLTGPLKLLVSGVEGEWTFEPAGTGVRITWVWTVHPASQVAEVAMPLFGWLWKGYARQALERIEERLLAT